MTGLLHPVVIDLSRVALFLDLDGTLAPIESRPDLVGPSPKRTAVLKALGEQLNGRLAVISGRSLTEIDRILEGAAPAAAGVHGLERRTGDGRLLSRAPHPGVKIADQRFSDFAQGDDGLLVERKRQSVALHYRNSPQRADAVLALAESISGDTGLVLQRGHMVAELRTPGGDKGDALTAFMTEPPFVGALPIMVGDDLTDEAAFRAARELGGFGVLVGEDRETAAQYRLNDVEAVLDWLSALTQQSGRRQTGQASEETMARLIVISNRVAMPSDPGQASAGGLTMALAAALQEYKGVWFGWSGQTIDTFAPTPKITETSGVTVATIDLEEQDVQEYYNGYANKTLWPLFHHRIDLTAYERTFTEGYGRVNARFAESVLPLIGPDDIVWVHDYHLIPLARELRRMGAKNRIGFFLHIPWPAWEMMVTLPRHRELVESLFDYDLVGFQTQEWLKAFHTYVEEEADGQVHPDGRVTAFGRTIAAQAFPIGIDADNLVRLARSSNAVRSYNRVAATGVYRTTMVGVDRIDYSKGLEERFLAFEQFLADNPEAHEHVSMLQIGQTSRGEVDAYQDLQTRLDALSGRINAAYTAVDWTPIRYVNRSYGRDALTGIYRACKIALVTPLRDGMNLVCKEYVASQAADDPGVLILSRFAGAARQMKEALIVNPYSREDMSDAIKRALTMPLQERVKRWESLMQGVVTNDVSAWRNEFVHALENTRREGRAGGPPDLQMDQPRSFSPQVGLNAAYHG